MLVQSAAVSRIPSIFVGQLPESVVEEELESLFSEYGKPTKVTLIKGPDRTSRRCAVIQFKSWTEAEAAVEDLNGIIPPIEGFVKALVVQYALPRRNHENDGMFETGIAPKKVYAAKIPKTATNHDISNLFSQYGPVDFVHVVKAKNSIKTCAFVQFHRWSDAERAIDGLNQLYTMDGSDEPLIVKFADAKHSCTPISNEVNQDHLPQALGYFQSFMPLQVPYQQMYTHPIYQGASDLQLLHGYPGYFRGGVLQPPVVSGEAPVWKESNVKKPYHSMSLTRARKKDIYDSLSSQNTILNTEEDDFSELKGLRFECDSSAKKNISADNTQDDLSDRAISSSIDNCQSSQNYKVSNLKEAAGNVELEHSVKDSNNSRLHSFHRSDPSMTNMVHVKHIERRIGRSQDPFLAMPYNPFYNAPVSIPFQIGNSHFMPSDAAPNNVCYYPSWKSEPSLHSSANSAHPAMRTKLGYGVDDPQKYEHKLFIGQLPYGLTEFDLWNVFAPHGKILELAILRSKGYSKGCAFLTYDCKESAEAAISEIDGKDMLKKKLVVKFANDRRSPVSSRSSLC